MSEQGRTIFTESVDSRPLRLRRSLPVSLAIHGILVIALFRGRSPIFVAPSSTLGGANGTSVTHLYWASGSDPAAAESHAGSLRQHPPSGTRLTWQKPLTLPSPVKRDPGTVDVATKQEPADSPARPAPSAGSPYGSLSEGADAGHEIRPALPAVTSEPLVSPDDLRGTAEGNVVIEITIDEAGNIVNKVVVQSLGLVIDEKVLAALENWRFRPATRDGVPIPSKQDVVYHFKPR